MPAKKQKSNQRAFTTRISGDLKVALDIYAAREQMQIGEVVTVALAKQIGFGLEAKKQTSKGK